MSRPPIADPATRTRSPINSAGVESRNNTEHSSIERRHQRLHRGGRSENPSHSTSGADSAASPEADEACAVRSPQSHRLTTQAACRHDHRREPEDWTARCAPSSTHGEPGGHPVGGREASINLSASARRMMPRRGRTVAGAGSSRPWCRVTGTHIYPCRDPQLGVSGECGGFIASITADPLPSPVDRQGKVQLHPVKELNQLIEPPIARSRGHRRGERHRPQ